MIAPGGDEQSAFITFRHSREVAVEDARGRFASAAGTGEAPSGILDCDFARMPKGYEGALLVTSWGDHFIEAYRPKPFGASLRADREIIVRGDEWFRPVGIATAPDGAIYIT